MAPQILQWKTADCVEFLRKCAKRYAATILDSELDSFVMNFEKNHVAGSTILPPECISNRDQSPQLVSPLPNQSLAPKGTGECGIKTDGKEKERISTQFVVYGDGRKEQPYIIYHATEAPSDGIPKPNTVARELYDRKDKKREEYPPNVLLDCN